MGLTNSVALATEDELSEVVGLRLVGEFPKLLQVSQRYRRGGFGYLKNNVNKFREISRHIPLILITDLDRRECATFLILDWIGKKKLPDQFLFRVAVRATESWLLADREALGNFLGVALNRISDVPDTLADPKLELLSLVRGCKKRSLKRDLLPEPGSTSKVGLGYNAVLSEFIRTQWNPDRAATSSPSLVKARQRISELANSISGVN